MQHDRPIHLFNSSGRWIGFCMGTNVFDIAAVWRGWLPWIYSDDVFKPSGAYLGTLFGNRLYYLAQKRDVRVDHQPRRPVVPAYPEPQAAIEKKSLPPDAADVNLAPVTMK